MDSNAVQAWQGLLGADAVAVDSSRLAEGLRDVGEYPSRTIVAWLKPKTVEQVQGVVRIASECRAPLYTVSTGFNWGLGSRLPVRSDGALLDLSELKTIRAIDAQRGHAIVEAGVTQDMLAPKLAGTPYMLNVTGSAAVTSIIGNALDRGVGFVRQRTGDVVGLEVVRSDGELIRVGGSWSRTPDALHYRHGIGPELTSLFMQSNLGVVTAGAIALVPRPEASALVQGFVGQGKLGAAVDAVASLYRQHVFPNVTKIHNTNMLRAYAISTDRRKEDMDRAAFTLYGMLQGCEAAVSALSRDVERRFRESGAFQAAYVEPASAMPPNTIEAMISGLYNGEPTGALASILGIESRDMDAQAPIGWLAFLPILPLDGATVERAFALLDKASQKFQLPINATVNVISDTAIDLVTTISFPRMVPEMVKSAHLAQDDLYKTFAEEGIALSRVDIDHMDPTALYRDARYIETLSQLKTAFDPHGILSPGRYLPPGRQ